MMQWIYQLTKQIDWIVSLELCYNSASFDFKICLRPEKVSEPFEKRPPEVKWWKIRAEGTGTRRDGVGRCIVLSGTLYC